tara:strand:- start:488 stop:1033 length:546 start_codon:yes stop_codon:yes gene_type:complete
MTVRLISKISVVAVLAYSALTQLFHFQTWWFIQNVNLIFHEAGHVLLYPFPHFITLIGGSLFEIGVPLTVTLYFISRHYFFSAACTSWWLTTACLSVAIYAADAQERSLNLITGNIEHHDWFNILDILGLLRYDSQAGLLFWWLGLTGVVLMITTFYHDSDVQKLLSRFTQPTKSQRLSRL